MISDNEKDDSAGLVDYRTGDFIKDRYKVLGLAGQGTFGTVLEVLDKRRNERVAMKVVRSVRRYLEAAQVEIEILDKIRQADVNRNSLCVRLYKSFECHHRRQRHVCIVFERLGRSLYEFIKRNNYAGFSLQHVKEFGHQILQAVLFCHSIKLVHTDLKPENILLESNDYVKVNRGDKVVREPKSTAVRLIDFGGATFEDDHHARMINTRQYRAPEVILGLPWSYPADMWSVVCILAELYTGELLFGTHEDIEHLALMEHILGRKFPTDMTLQAIGKAEDESKTQSSRKRRHRRNRSSSTPRADRLFKPVDGDLRWPECASSKESVKHVSRAKKLEELIKDEDFVDLLHRLFAYKPEDRLTAKDAYEHRWFLDLKKE